MNVRSIKLVNTNVSMLSDRTNVHAHQVMSYNQVENAKVRIKNYTVEHVLISNQNVS